MKRLSLYSSIAAIPILILLTTANSFEKLTQRDSNTLNPSTRCDISSHGLSFEFGAKLKDDQLISHLRLIASPRPRYFRFLTFVGEKQVMSSSDQEFKLDCGDQKNIQESIKAISEDKGVVNVLSRELPIIPTRVQNAAITKGKLTGREQFLLMYALDKPDYKSLRLEEQYPINNPSVSRNKITYAKASLNDGYIYFYKPEVPYHVLYKTSKSNAENFGIYFSDVPDAKSRIYTITCLVNDRQVKAFGNKLSWSGVLKRGQGVFLKGSTKFQPGWSQLRCVVLNNIFKDSQKPTLYVSTIRSSFINYTPSK